MITLMRGISISIKCVTLPVLFLLVLLVGGVSALQVEAIPVPPENPEEGEVVNFTLSISDFPQGYNLSFDTDLVSYNGNPIYNITNINKEVHERHFEINTNGYDRFTVHMIGKVPEVTEVRQYDGLTLTKYKKMTGYLYYRIELHDKNGTLINPPPPTKTFDVKVPELEKFNENLTKVHNRLLRDFINGLHDKGLVREANKLIVISGEIDGGISLPYFICSLIGVAFLFFVIGVRIGGKREEE